MPRRGAQSSPGGASGPTELESCVLGILARLGPCTAYAVRQFLGVSQSSYWSASAGAIYPLLKRLDAAGLVAVEEGPFGSRRRRHYSLTPAGRAKLRRWLSAPIADVTAAYTFDPLRTRVFFLDLVPAARRVAFVDDAIAKTDAVLTRHRAERAEMELSAWERIGRDGAIRELEARLEWLGDVRRGLEAIEIGST